MSSTGGNSPDELESSQQKEMQDSEENVKCVVQEKMYNFYYPYLPHRRDLGYRAPLPPEKFQSLLWGEYGCFLELNIVLLIDSDQ